MKRLLLIVSLGCVILAAVAVVGGASGSARHVVGGFGVSMSLPAGWQGVAASGELQAADFPLPRGALGSAQSVRVRPGHLHLIVWDYGPSVPYLADSFPAAPRLALARRNLTRGGLEGFGTRDAYAVRNVTVRGELLEVVADLGPKPLATDALPRINRLLPTLRVQPPRIVRARGRLLAAGGLAVRLPAGWSGRIELPANRHAAQLVLRAHHRSLRLVLLQMPEAAGAHADLPIALTARNLFHDRGLLIARRVFSNAGRSFDLSAVLPSAAALGEVNRLLATLTAVPRRWTFRSCNLTLRLPGTWRAAINPRSGCYPVITLRGPGITVVLTELRPGQPAADRVLTRSGRRFHVDVTPTTAKRRADSVLATLHAKHR